MECGAAAVAGIPAQADPAEVPARERALAR
jgi:hypothetical protein